MTLSFGFKGNIFYSAIKFLMYMEVTKAIYKGTR